MGSNLLKAWWLLPLHVSNKIHPCDTPSKHRSFLAPTRDVFLILTVTTEVILKLRKVQDCKQKGYHMIRRFKNYTVADTSMFIFLPLTCSGCGSCVYMVAVKDYMRQHAVQQHCMSTGCLWCFWEGSWQRLDLNISPHQCLSELLPQVTYRLLWTAGALLRVTHRAPASGTERRAPSATAGLSAWVRPGLSLQG